jgi:dTDP-4-amino-4,6-dideoxy-D-galactose acyltransferase
VGSVSPGLLASRADQLSFYSPYNFLRRVAPAVQQQAFGTGYAAGFAAQPRQYVFDAEPAPGQLVQFLYALLPWDTEFFGAPVYRLFTVLFAANTTPAAIGAATALFRERLRVLGAAYCFANLPAEDTTLAQGLGLAGWRLVETRLTYYHDAVAAFDYPHFAVRAARPDEAAHLGEVAARARNAYDRFHAEPWFTPAQADRFLARYAAAAVQGYCDEVLVPAEAGLPVDSFLAITDLAEHRRLLQTTISKVVLVAAGAANPGWHLKLLAEAVHRARQQSAEYVVMTTQATNRAVVRNCEKLGFRLGNCSHVFAHSADAPAPAEDAYPISMSR